MGDSGGRFRRGQTEKNQQARELEKRDGREMEERDGEVEERERIRGRERE